MHSRGKREGAAMMRGEIKSLAPTAEKFAENKRLGCHVFQVAIDAKAEAVVEQSDLLLDVSRQLLRAITAGSAPDDETMSYAAEFLAEAAQAGYRSLCGEP